MKFSKYLKDKIYALFLFLISLSMILLIFFAFKINKEVIISTLFILITNFLLLLFIDYFRKQKFYTELLSNTIALDKSYLVLETISKPEFYEGELFYQTLYEINKSMNENIKTIEKQWQNFKDYIEMWIHEVKLPLATMTLISNNSKDNFAKKIKLQLKRLENYLDQILYYARSENAEKDFLIKETNLSKIVKSVGIRNMDEILSNKVDYNVSNVNFSVLTDSKWLEFILEQIVNMKK